MKKGYLLLSLLLLAFGIVACNKTTTTVTTAPVTTAFSVSLSGLTDVGFTDEDKIYTEELFNLLDGVTALGSDGVDYADSILLQSDDSACQIDGDGNLMSTTAKTCVVTYTVVVNGKMARGTRNIKISAAPVTIEFTETDAIDNSKLFGTDGAAVGIDDWDNSTYVWYYWVANADVLGTTGSVGVSGGKLVITQEGLGGVGYGMQTILLTDVALEPGRTYKITLTITSTSDRTIDIVTKAPNSDYGNDTHSVIEVKTGTFDYEMYFVAFAEVLHLNILTGTVENQENVGTLEFSNLTLWEGPIVIEYTEVVDFFTNDAIAVGTAIEAIVGTDSDYLRQFYYWMNDGEIAAEYVEGGIEVEVVTGSTVDYGIQIQWNDMLKQDFTLVEGAMYKLTMNVNATTARIMEVNVTGDHYSKPTSLTQRVDLSVGDNALEFEFESLYDYFFMKLNFGNYGDLVQTGVFTITDLKLYVDVNAEPAPVEDDVTFDHLYTFTEEWNEIENGIQNGDFGATGFAVNGEGSAWSSWTTVDQTWANPQIDATFTVVDGAVEVETLGTGGEVWYIQFCYRPTDELLNVNPGTTYRVEFDVNADVAGTFSMEMTTTGNAGNVAIPVTLAVGDNHVVVEYVAYEENFKLTACLGLYGLATLTFDNFVIYEKTIVGEYYLEGGIQNGDFGATGFAVNGEGSAWASWTTVDQTWANPQIDATFTVVDGAVEVETLGTGGEVWYIQFQYRPTDELLNVTPGRTYRVEFDVNADVAGTFSMEMTTTGNAGNVSIPVTLAVGDNHVVVEYVAYEENFKLTACLGLYGLATLTFDNFEITEVAYFDEDVITGGIQDGDFNETGFVVNGEGYAWTSWTTVDQTWASVQIDATFTTVDGAVEVETLGTGGEVWYIQFCYRPTDELLNVKPGHIYKVEFDVNVDVAGTFSMEMTTTGNAGNVAIPVTLEVGANHVTVYYIAYEENFKLTACLGLYGLATLTFDNFTIAEFIPR